ncbi:MAG: heterotetrameric sarcosine oxidase delta subunit [Paracoccaceae bacterium]|jgi:heterotetrameric sarcosine oxidase delta subunit
MRIKCPLCGERDRREFYYMGHETYLTRPAEAAGIEAWDNYLHLRDNPAGVTKDLWYHENGCSSWLLVERDTVTHDILRVELVAQPKREGV